MAEPTGMMAPRTSPEKVILDEGRGSRKLLFRRIGTEAIAEESAAAAGVNSSWCI